MLRTRVLSAVIGIPLILFLMYQGGWYWIGFFLLLGGLALHEYYQMLRDKDINVEFIPGYVLLFLFILSPLLNDQAGFNTGFIIVLYLIVIYGVCGYPRLTIRDAAFTLFMPVYLGVLLSCAVRMSFLEESFTVILLAFLLTWGSDVGGYFAGRILGRHKLAPLLSPKKTWEGAVGGVVLAVLISVGYFYFVAWGQIGPAYAILLGALVSIAAQFGDLFMSGIKRYFNIKDSGNIIPGHGGILDRFDSFLLVVPMIYTFFSYFL